MGTLTMIVTMLLLMAGRSRENLLNVVVALVVNLALNVVLIPRIGIMGAAWATLLAYAALAAMTAIASIMAPSSAIRCPLR